jgi:hypothetical protein
MPVPSSGATKTARPLHFNDPVKGEVYAMPAGESCILFESAEDACRKGYLDSKNEAAMWSARTNIQRGYCLVWLRGKLRGVMKSDLAGGRTPLDSAKP